MKTLQIIVSVICAILILFGISSAGDISDDLVAKISSVNPEKKISVVIILKETIPASILKKELNANYRTLPERHKYGIAKLKAEAASSQSDILGSLKDLEVLGMGQNLRSHWLINAITIDIAASEVEKIASRNDVLSIFEMPEIRLIEPAAEIQSAAQSLTGIESNIKAIGADSAWKAGYTGKGRIVCSFDTGIEGHHPAIYSNWKGLDGDSAAAWFDPIGRQSFPHPLGNPVTSTYKHGTHTMGIMVGHDDLTGDTIGVAPDAKWISAAVIDISGASIIDAFEWAADPDGDPNTTSDVPDVINHSWGIANSYLGCNEYFWKMIDNVEALGIVNIFAAGNGGSGPQTITNPANRALDSLDCFAVGNINDVSKTLELSSSRGPSNCNPAMIKPNLVAPGVNIRSAFPPSIYGLLTGTSMAAPHVAGAVAILRQHSPDATVDEIKKALLAGCERLPVGSTPPNNDYGWGVINIPAALAALSPALKPLLRLYSFNHPPVNPGDTVRGYIFIKNFGDTLQNVYGSMGEHSVGLDVQVNSLLFGTIGLNDTARSDVPFEAIISDTVTPGSTLTADMTLIGSPDDTQHVKIYVRVGDLPHAGYFTHDNGLIKFTISNFGQYGFAPGSIISLGYSGFAYRDTNSLFEGAFMVAVDSLHVSDAARNIVEEPDNDFAVAPGGDLLSAIPGQNADQQTFSIFDDSKAENPAGLEISQRTYSWDNPLYSNFVIIEYTIKNLSQNNYTGVYAGLFFDWDIMTYTQNCGGFSSDENLGYMYYCRDFPNHFRGIAVINSANSVSYKLRRNPTIQGEANYSFTESEKYHALSSGIIDTAGAGTGDLAQIISSGPFGLAVGGSIIVAFAVIASDSLLQLKSSALQARDAYQNTVDIGEDNSTILPASTTMEQNYPNPFNPTTVIRFALPSRGIAKLEILNILGQTVRILLNSEYPAGLHAVIWDGNDSRGNPVASGVYLYRLSTGEKSLIKKMVILK